MGYDSTLSGTLRLTRDALEFMKTTPFSSGNSDESIYDYLCQPAYSGQQLSINLCRHLYHNLKLFNILAALKDITGEDHFTLTGETYDFWNHSWTITFKPGYWQAQPGPIESRYGLNFGCTIELNSWIKATPLAKTFTIDHKTEEVLIELSDGRLYKIPFWIIYSEIEKSDFLNNPHTPYLLDNGGGTVLFPELDGLTIGMEEFFWHDEKELIL